MNNAVIVSAVRTAIGSFNGALADIDTVDLGRSVIAEAVGRAGILPDHVDEIIMGNVLQAGLGQNPARQAALRALIPQRVPAVSINKVCGSGLKSVTLAAQAIQTGDADIVVAGGMENMSRAPYLLDSKARWGYRIGNGQIYDTLSIDGLTCATNHYHMGITAENVAEQYRISRQEQDDFALMSQQRALRAIADGAFEAEITPLTVMSSKSEYVFAQDEYPKTDTTPMRLAQLKPAFKTAGTVTAGNASGINDGAAALVIMSESTAKSLGLKPLARIKSHASIGVDPATMGLGPVPATRKALEKARLDLSDIGLIEANEAFAAQTLAVGRALNLDLEKVNVNGGAIALGHPIGASGARILVTLVHAMRARDIEFGLATLCIGGGQGIAVVVERN